MAQKRMVLTFPPKVTGQPVAYNLVKQYDIKINIIKGKISPEEEGTLIVDLEAEEETLRQGLEYLETMGIIVKPLGKEICWHEDRCTHCTACIPICPTESFRIDRSAMSVSFDSTRCVVCELCLKVCPFNAVTIGV